MKKPVIHIGDTVRIVRSRLIKRVGYPLVWYEVLDLVEKDPKVQAAYDLLTGRSSTVKGALTAVGTRVPGFFAKSAAKVYVEQHGFGGKERSIHYWEQSRFGSWEPDRAPDLTGLVAVVTAKRLAKTGIRFPASGGQYGDGEYWDEPGGLDECKTHILLKVDGYEIEACDVELVKKGTL